MQHSAVPGCAPVLDLDRAWSIGTIGPRLRAVRVAAERVRDRFASGPRVLAVRTLPIITAPYPTRYAFWGAALSPAPFVVFTHRCLLVQFLQAGEAKTLLFNPTDVAGARATPFFARLAERVPRKVQSMLAPEFEPLTEQLARLGVRPEDVDYVAFDHMHVQDLRPVLGTDDGRIEPRFPNATLLVPRIEWEDWDDLHPMQRAWFVPDGKVGVPASRVALTTGDLALGDGVMLLRTPGHTSGNQTLFLNTDSGVWGISENGTCADNWSPMDSRIPGLRSLCRRQDVDVVLNANTPERGADQYTSMILERTVADRVKRAPAFVQMFPSSEVTPSALSPGLKPTILHRAITHGDVIAESSDTRRSAAARVTMAAARP
jgi:glyoxylase-like metal-dependent hydrolase (beta-lactamase superfamily II)